MATPMMPDAPQSQNHMMAPPQAAPGPQAAPPGMPPPNAMMGQQGAPGGQQGAPVPPPPPPPAKLKEAIQHDDIVIRGLMSLVSMPQGSLTKKEVFDGASDMIARGAFPTPDQKQALIVQLAKTPDDDKDIRPMVATMLGHMLDMRAQAFQMLKAAGAV